MKRHIQENTDRYMVAFYGADAKEPESVEIVDKRKGIVAGLEGAAATSFREEFDRMESNSRDPGSIWHEVTWNECLAHLADDALAAADEDFAGWRRGALENGWKIVERDPSENRVSDGPCLHHEGTDRVMPLGEWEQAVRDLGFGSFEESLRENEVEPS